MGRLLTLLWVGFPYPSYLGTHKATFCMGPSSTGRCSPRFMRMAPTSFSSQAAPASEGPPQPCRVKRITLMLCITRLRWLPSEHFFQLKRALRVGHLLCVPCWAGDPGSVRLVHLL
uniref:Micronovel n=1 Tax=Homo sapiens TaxID=9606 RepID=Q6UXQ0_HUMAN|nr:micronovel [Homo sapiens]